MAAPFDTENMTKLAGRDKDRAGADKATDDRVTEQVGQKAAAYQTQ